jgi:hypothetical protein
MILALEKVKKIKVMDLGKDLYDVREAVGLAGRRAGE